MSTETSDSIQSLQPTHVLEKEESAEQYMEEFGDDEFNLRVGENDKSHSEKDNDNVNEEDNGDEVQVLVTSDGEEILMKKIKGGGGYFAGDGFVVADEDLSEDSDESYSSDDEDRDVRLQKELGKLVETSASLREQGLVIKQAGKYSLRARRSAPISKIDIAERELMVLKANKKRPRVLAPTQTENIVISDDPIVIERRIIDETSDEDCEKSTNGNNTLVGDVEKGEDGFVKTIENEQKSLVEQNEEEKEEDFEFAPEKKKQFVDLDENNDKDENGEEGREFYDSASNQSSH